MRLLFECTQTYLYGGNTGIQRVVRNLANNMEEAGMAEGFHCVPVVWTGETFVRLRAPIGVQPPGAVRLGRAVFRTLRSLKNRASRMMRLVRSARGSSVEDEVSSEVEPVHRLDNWRNKSIERVLTFVEFGPQPQSLDVGPGDVLVMADSSWNSPTFFRGLEVSRTAGVKIGTIVYDLIPKTHAEFFDSELVAIFDSWFERARSYSDFFITISESVANEVRKALVSSGHNVESHVDSFRLGMDLDGTARRVSKALERRPNHFIVVGTVEPRKNHAVVLDAFDSLWQRGIDVELTIIGRYGWLASDVAQRIKDHDEFGRRLFWARNLDDGQLVSHYSSCSALISASFVEGFGLPIVEALSNGAPVITSDIESHREIGGDFCTYFEPTDSETLAKLVLERMRTTEKTVGGFTWPTWEESTSELIIKVVEMCRRLEQNHSTDRSSSSQADYHFFNRGRFKLTDEHPEDV